MQLQLQFTEMKMPMAVTRSEVTRSVLFNYSHIFLNALDGNFLFLRCEELFFLLFFIELLLNELIFLKLQTFHSAPKETYR